MGGNNPQSHANNAQIAVEQSHCLDLRLEGKSFRAIATETGLPLSTVFKRVEEAIALEVHPRADQLRAIECERLDLYLGRLKTRIDKGDTLAIQAALRISERRSRLLGLDAPAKFDAQVTEVTQQDIELQEMIRDAKAKVAAEEARLRAELGGAA